MRIHTAVASQVTMSNLTTPELVNLFGDEFTDVLKALVIADAGNDEAWALIGTDQELRQFAHDLLARLGYPPEDGCVNEELEDDFSPCCGGNGYLLHQEYGFAAIPDGWTPVQRCDACNTFEGDGDAAERAAADHGGVAVAFFFPDGVADDTPGDYAIEIDLPL